MNNAETKSMEVQMLIFNSLTVPQQIDDNHRKSKMLKLSSALHAIEQSRQHGDQGYSVDEVVQRMRTAIQNAKKEP